MKYFNSEKRFRSINLIAVIALFILILAGGVVRSTGSGMGCPDWPKCFGRYIPPVKEAQLPIDYRTKYAEIQVKKNTRFIKVLNAFGYTSLASKIQSRNSINGQQQEEFNVAKTWTEYINRLIGFVTGNILLLTAAYSFYYWKISKRIVLLSLFNLFLVGFQAWIGSIVVSSNLVPWIVTVHMLIAFAILAISIYTWHKARMIKAGKKVSGKAWVVVAAFFALVLDIVQISVGTEVREKIDEYAARLQGNFRQEWVNGAEKILFDHKNLALLVIVVNVLLFMLIRKTYVKSSVQQQLMSTSFIIITLQVFAGVALAYLSLPPIAQVAHLFLASLLFGTQFYLLLNLFETAETSGAKYGI
ncbi:MAG: heme A synthase [Mucilaginibacter sp.]|uniref:COX15/CtaA family protein n=1 Tax=Mucilaginibacter sp. TaxID=1882438 RepID=UPI0034E3D1FE